LRATIKKLIEKSSRRIKPSLLDKNGHIRKRNLKDPEIVYSAKDLKRFKENFEEWKARLIRYYGPAGYPKRASIPMGSECPANVSFSHKTIERLRSHYKGSLFN
jgi:hypothetical protein